MTAITNNSIIKAVVGNFLPPNQGFGNNPWYTDPYGQPMGMGGMGGMMPGGLSYYEAVGALPIGMNPNSPDGRRYIWSMNRNAAKNKSEKKHKRNSKNKSNH
jgi:hypothetical protein